MITIFKDGYDLVGAKYVNIDTALTRIRDGKSKQKIEEIRNCTDPKEVSRLKKSLPSVLFHGVFNKEITKVKSDGTSYQSKRDDSSISSHSGFLILDFDKCDVASKKRQLSQDPYVYSCWISPSGQGVKALVRCEASIEKHYILYDNLIERYPDLDTTSRSLSRLCFESYDPDIYINPNAKVWDKSIVNLSKNVTDETRLDYKDKQRVKRGNAIISRAVDMIRSAVEGTRHDIVIKAGKLVGGYIATNNVDESTAVSVLTAEIKQKFSGENVSVEIKGMLDGINYGKNAPLYETKKIGKELEYVKREDGNFDFIADDEEMDDYETRFLNGTLEMGLSTGYPELDKYWMFKRNTLVWMAGADNSGKAQPLDSNILTPNGWVMMGDIKVGDYVIGSDGLPKEVSEIHPQGMKKVWNVIFDDGSVVECCKDHLWTSKFNSGKIVTVTTENMTINYRSPKGKFNYRIDLVKPVYYPEKKLGIDPYLLGFLIGDGCLSNNVCFHNEEKDLVEKISLIVSETTNGQSVNYGKRYGVHSIVRKEGEINNELFSTIKKYGLNVKSAYKFIPEDYKFSSIEQRTRLIQGLVDTDGSMCGGGMIEYSTKSKLLANDFIDICKSLGNRASMKEKIVNGEVYYRIHVKDYYGNLFSSKKHKAKYTTPKRSAHKKIVEIKETDVFKEMQCITILSEDNLYVTDGYTLTHNSFSGWYFAVMSALFHDWKVLIHSAENNDGQVRKKLKEYYLGKSLKSASKEELQDASEFIKKHFKIMTSRKLHTWEDFLIKCEIVYDEGYEYDLVIADPFNAFDIPDAMDSHRHNLKALNIIRTFKENYSAIWVIDHIGSQGTRNRDTDNNMQVPHKAAVDGGQIKANKTDDFIIVHRNSKKQDLDPDLGIPAWQITEIHVDKIKDTETGGKPSPKDEPFKIVLNADKCGFTCNGRDAVKEFWENKHQAVVSKSIGIQSYADSFLSETFEINSNDEEPPF